MKHDPILAAIAMAHNAHEGNPRNYGHALTIGGTLMKWEGDKLMINQAVIAAGIIHNATIPPQLIYKHLGSVVSILTIDAGIHHQDNRPDLNEYAQRLIRWGREQNPAFLIMLADGLNQGREYCTRQEIPPTERGKYFEALDEATTLYFRSYHPPALVEWRDMMARLNKFIH